MVALRLTGLTNLLYEVASASINASSLWPVYSRGLPLEPTAGSVVHSYHLLWSFSVWRPAWIRL